DITLTCVSACFDEHIAEAARKNLLAYGSQIRTDAIGSLLSAQEEYLESMAGQRRFTARSCNPMRRSYTIMPVPISDADSRSSWGQWVWPPYSGLMRETLKQIMKLAVNRPTQEQRRELVSVMFDGTLGHGINCRRTLRGALNAPLKL